MFNKYYWVRKRQSSRRWLRKRIGRNPFFLAFFSASVLLIIAILIPVVFLKKDLLGTATLVATLTSFVLLITTFYSAIINGLTASDNEGLVPGYHRIGRDFEQHISDFYREFDDAVSRDELEEFSCVISTLAYGVGTKDPLKSSDVYLSMLEQLIDKCKTRASSGTMARTERISIKLYIWDEKDHLDVFKVKSNELESDRLEVLSRLSGILRELHKLQTGKLKKNIDLKIYTTPPIEWRMFKFKTKKQQFGMIALFTPLNATSVNSQKFATAIYQTTAKTAIDHFGHLLEYLEPQGLSTGVAQNILSCPETFIEKFYGISLSKSQAKTKKMT